MLLAALPAPAAAPALRVTTRSLGPAPKGDVIVSPDGQRWATVIDRRQTMAILLDGKEVGPGHDWVVANLAAFSPDGRHFAYQAREGRKTFVVMDGVAGRWYDAIDPFTLGPGGRIAYVARRDGRGFVVVNGMEGPPHRDAVLGGLTERSVAYVAVADDGTERVFFDGKASKAYEQVVGLTISPDGRRFAARALAGKGWTMLTEAGEGPVYGELGAAVFSPDSRRLACAAAGPEGVVFIVDGKAGRPYGTGPLRPPIFSPDSKRIACIATSGEEDLLVLDGRQLARGPAGTIRPDPAFSPDSSKLAYVHAGTRGSRVVVVRADGEGDALEGKLYDQVARPAFAPGGGHRLAYAARRGTEAFIVLDGVEGRAFSSIDERTLGFSADGRHAACVARREAGAFIILDGAEAGPFDRVLTPGPLAPGADGTLSLLVTRGQELLRATIAPAAP